VAAQTTSLNAVHREMGARLVDFAGWSMPLHYGSQLEEHHRVRRDAAMFDVSHMLAIDVQGAGARDFLRKVLANDVARLREPGRALYSCMLAESGGVLDDLIVYSRAAGAFRVVVNAGTASKDTEWLESQAQQTKADVTLQPRRDLAIIAIQGPQAREKFWTARPQVRASTEALKSFEAAEIGDMFVARTGYTGEDGFEVMVPTAEAETLWRALQAAEVSPAGLAARDTLRLEAGMNLYGQEMDETVTPLECGLAWTVDLSAGREFIGRQALENNQPRFAFAGLILHDRGVMRAHQSVRTASGAGEITSGGFSPTMNCSIALARVPPGVGPGARAEVEIRGSALGASVVKPPFVRHGKILVKGKNEHASGPQIHRQP
jgi:aminomethyltransferase